MSPFTELVYDTFRHLEPVDRANNYALLHLIESMGARFQGVHGIARDEDGVPGYAKIMDADLVPDEGLEWLSQFAGVALPAGITASEKRDLLKTADASKRGTISHIAAVIQRSLTGTKTVYVRERDGSPYRYTISTRRAETPVEDWDSTNILRNGGAELNADDWFSNFGNLFRTFDNPLFGGAHFRVEAGSNQINIGTSSLAGTLSGATTGKKFSTSLYVKGRPSAIGKTIWINGYEVGGASGEQSYGGSQKVVLTNGWQRLLIEGASIIQNDRTFVRLYLFSGNDTGAWVTGDGVDFEGAQVEAGDRVTPYIETAGAQASRAAGFGPVGKAVRDTKPAGLTANYQIVTGQDWQNVLEDFATWTAVISAFPTIDALELG